MLSGRQPTPPSQPLTNPDHFVRVRRTNRQVSPEGRHNDPFGPALRVPFESQGRDRDVISSLSSVNVPSGHNIAAAKTESSDHSHCRPEGAGAARRSSFAEQHLAAGLRRPSLQSEGGRFRRSGLESDEESDAELLERMPGQPAFGSSSLRGMMEGLDRKLCQRFSRVEDALERLAEQVASQVLKFEPTAAGEHGSSCSPLAPGQPAAPEVEPTGTLGSVREGEEGLEQELQWEEAEEGEGELEKQAEGEWAEGEEEAEEAAAEAEEAEQEERQRAAMHIEVAGTRSLWEDAPFFELRPQWRVGVSLFGERSVDLPEEQWKTLEDLEQFTSSRDRPIFVLWPSSRFRIAWDIITMLLIGFDMAIIPVNLAFDFGDNVVSTAMFWPCLGFWSADIPLTFCTGFYRKGRVQLEHCVIAKEYLRTWFLLDAAMVCSSWSEVIIGSQTQGVALGRVGKTLRVLRIVRSMRLLRLVKLRRIMEDIQDSITSEYFHIMVSVLRLILVIVWTNHFIACGWWGIGSSGPRQGDADAEWSWTSHFSFQDDDMGYQYFTALHWSLTQFTPASMEVSPRNLGERVFAVVVLLFAMIVFSSFVSSITAAMTQLRQLSSSINKGFVMLRRYLRVRDTPADLTVRIMKCVEHRLGAIKGEVPECEVQLLQYLSKPLQMELLSHIYSPILTRHPLFQKLSEADPGAMQRICLLAVQRVSLSTGDALFTEAFSGDQLFFVRSGRLRYYPSGRMTPSCASSPVDRSISKVSARSTQSSMRRSVTRKPVKESIVEEGEWFCESSLWCPWAHCGTMVAVQMTEVLALDAASFAAVASVHRLVAGGAQRYATRFLERLNSTAQEGQIRDICQLSCDELEDLVQQAFDRRNVVDGVVPEVDGTWNAKFPGAASQAAAAGRGQIVNL